MWYNGAGGDFLTHLLVVDDEVSILELIKNSLGKDGYLITVCQNADDVDIKKLHFYDLILLDVMMPGTDGFEFCKQIRNMVDCPILFLTAKTLEEDILFGLGIGADDYITKPFGVMELISRVKAMLRRSQKTQDKDKILKLGNIVLDREKHSVMVGKEPVELTYKEYELLKLLMTNAGIVTTRELILDRVWGIDFEGESRTLDMHIKTLRQKLKEEGSLIKTVRNVGYIMNGEKA